MGEKTAEILYWLLIIFGILYNSDEKLNNNIMRKIYMLISHHNCFVLVCVLFLPSLNGILKFDYSSSHVLIVKA